jgi:hypothetical protein
MWRVRQLLQLAARQHLLRPYTDPEVVVLLVRYIVSGLEMAVRGEGECPGLRRRPAAIWNMLPLGMADTPDRLRTGSADPL